MWKHLKFLLLFIITRPAYAAELQCASKHLYPINEDNYEILQRNIGTVFQQRTGLYPKLITLDNNGETVFIRYSYSEEKPSISEGPYGSDKYQFEFMYFNRLDDRYTSNGTLPFELHVVFAKQKYGLYEKAVKKNFGITVWSFRYRLIDPKWLDADYMDYSVNKMYENLQYIREPYTKYDINLTYIYMPSLRELISIDLEYYVYQGRLMPFLGDCNTDVIWFEFPGAINIFSGHAELLQKILSYNKTSLQSFDSNYDDRSGPIYQNINHYLYQEQGLSAQSFEKFEATSDDGGNDGDDDDDDDIVKRNGSFIPYRRCFNSIIFLMTAWILYEYGV